jgi:sulfhydrogenase subunit beta (sulfur reductase)
MVNRKFLPKTALPIWLELLRQQAVLVAPRRVGGAYVFAEIQTPAEVELDYSTTLLPPKKYLLPQHETLLQFDQQNGGAHPVFEPVPTILLGVHACDMHAIRLLDQVYAGRFPDQHYQARRANLLLVSLECLKPCHPEAFCRDMETLSVPDNYDLHLTDLGDGYSVDIGTPGGEALLQGVSDLLDFGPEHQRQYQRALSLKWSRFTYQLQPGVAELPALLGLSYKSTLWAELGERCLSCGACNLVCPTCSCFEVSDEIDLALTRGERRRTWDSCQLNSFAVVAGGHDFRPTRADRLRHRFSHKYKYQPAAHGLAGCVGCGRCALACLANISPVEVLNNLYQRRALPAGERRG